METYLEAINYLDSFTNYEKTGFSGGGLNFDLSRLQGFLEKTGDPQTSYRSVHIAGTKGKGSVATFTASILAENGYKVGLYTSPHLLDVKERIKINGADISEDSFLKILSKIQDDLAGREKIFTYFEILTFIAIFYFKEQGVDLAVFETGLGGRLDATNVIKSEVCGITSISHDHMQVLGDKLEKITREKIAIIKPGSHCISSPQRADILEIIKERCIKENVSLSIVGEDISYNIKASGEEGSLVNIKGIRGLYESCHIDMMGSFQAENAATAVGIVEQVLTGIELDLDKIKMGIKKAFLPGRMEIIAKDPLLIIDGAHNKSSASRLKYSVEENLKYDRLILLLGISKDKDIRSICSELVPLSDEVVLTRAASQRSADPGMIRGYIKGKTVCMTSNVKEGLGAALSLAGERDLILATGSFYLIGEVRGLVKGM
ncbi:MAG: folylpolyglutamate synthase/dihydrofolate synthase family protein [Candidatus Omnitrophota bacterium]